MLAVVMFAALTGCASNSNDLERGRPDDAELIFKGRYGAGTLGGGAWRSIYITSMPFEDVVARYRATLAESEGAESLSGPDGFRFDTNDDCLVVRPWDQETDGRALAGAITPEEIDRLAQSNAFIESRPDDCDYHG